MTPAALAVISRSATATPPAAGVWTLSNLLTTTGAITATFGAALTFTILATSGSATGRVYASDGTPIGDISGTVGESFVISLPSDINAYRVDWADAVGSLTFTVL